MAAKAITLLVLCFAAFLFIASEVAARDLAEHTDAADEHSEETDQYGGRYGGGGGYPRYGGGGGYPRYGGGGGYPRYGGGGGGYPRYGGGGRCRYGCCGRRYGGGGYGGGGYGGCRCCSYAGEKPDADFQAEPHN